MNKPQRLSLRLLFLGTLMTPLAAHAQDFERRIPIQPPQPPTPDVPAPPEAAPAADDATQVLPELRGLVFVAGPDALQPAGVAADGVPGGISAVGLPLLSDPAFTEQVRPFLGRPLTRGDLDAIRRLVQETYRAAEQPFVDVTVPQQNISSGVVQIVVTQYRVGEISVTGNRHFSSDLILGMSDLRPGDELSLPHLREALDDYNQNPFLTVNGVFRPGAETGTTDVALEAKDRFPLRVYAGYDNQGVATLGRDEWYVGFNWGNVLGTGHILSYQYTRSFEDRYSSHSASYVAPIGPDDRLLLFGAYATQKPFLGIFDSVGHSGQISARWARDLHDTGPFDTTIQMGLDYKRTDNNLEFLGIRILDNAIEIFQIPVVVTATLDDRHGQTTFENLFVFSPGDISEHNTDEAFRRLVPFANSTYAYDRFSITRTTFLPEDFVWVVRGMIQMATSNLPYSEQLSAGGMGSVRGYDPNTALGSQGFLLKTQVLTPVLNPFGQQQGFEGGIQFGVFADYANVWQQRRFPDSPRDAELASVGVNAHVTFKRFLDLEVELGHQLIRPPFQPDRDTRFAIVATVGF